MSAMPRSGPTTTPAIHALLDFFFGEDSEDSGISVGSGSLPAPSVALAVEDRGCVGARQGQFTAS